MFAFPRIEFQRERLSAVPKDLVPSSTSRVEFFFTRTTEPLDNTGRTSCGTPFSSFASFLGSNVHELFFFFESAEL